MLSTLWLLQISDYICCNSWSVKAYSAALYTIFSAIVLSVVTYALPAFSRQLSSRDKDRLDGLFCKAFKWGLCTDVFRIEDLMREADTKLFRQAADQRHCLYPLLPPKTQKNCSPPLEIADTVTHCHTLNVTLQKLLLKQMSVFKTVLFCTYIMTLYWHFAVILSLCFVYFLCKSVCDWHAINKCNLLTYLLIYP